LLEQSRFNFFALKDKRHKHGLAAPMFICGQARQPITPVHQFFNCELQESPDVGASASLVLAAPASSSYI